MERRISYAHGVSETTLLSETISSNLRRTTATFGDGEALVDYPSGRRWTYFELMDWVTSVAKGLVQRGIEKGDRVGIWSPNCPEWVAVQYATAMIGAILVNINPAYRQSELEFVLEQSGLRMLISADSFKNSDYRSMVNRAVDHIPSLTETVFIGDESWTRLETGGQGISERDLIDIESQQSFDDPINIQYTSGTTGFPKGATLSHHNILNNAFWVAELLRYSDADRVCLPVPFYHCFGMVMGNLGSTTHGSTIVIPAPLFDAEATLACVEAERCTSLYGVPTMFIAELGAPNFSNFDLTSLRTGIMAGSSCPVHVMKRVIDDMHMSEVAIAYGMTETSPVSTQTRSSDDLGRRTETVGRVLPHLEVKIIDPSIGTVVPHGETGELCTRGYSVMLGYWNDPQMTTQAIDVARWMHTGDLAIMRSDGYVNIVGRLKDMVIRGGESIYPREIEEFLYGHPDIEDVAIVGVPDARYGEELVAWIRLRSGAAEFDVDALKSFCTDKIAHHKIPRYIKFVDSFPMTVTGKIRKVEMRSTSITELGLEQAANVPTA
jgi:fatty-acyl-CoA synthase